MKSIKITKGTEAYDVLSFLKEGLSKHKNDSRTHLKAVHFSKHENILYGVTTNGVMIFYGEISDLENIVEEKNYELDVSKNSYFLTQLDDDTYPDWKRVIFGEDDKIHKKINIPMLLKNIHLDKRNQGYINVLYGLVATSPKDIHMINNEFLDLIYKGAKEEIWEVIDLKSSKDPIKLKSGSLHAMIMPIGT